MSMERAWHTLEVEETFDALESGSRGLTPAEVERRLEERMRDRLKLVWDATAEKGLTMRETAMDIAVGRVVEAILARGLLP